MKDRVPARDLQHVDRYLLDNGAGGIGQRFDWSVLQGEDLTNVMLAGGLRADNCVRGGQLAAPGWISTPAWKANRHQRSRAPGLGLPDPARLLNTAQH